ncbi:MAG: DUF2804 family protein [Treponema sp.]
MYSRDIKKVPKSIVHNGKINFGSYIGEPPKLDIRGVRAPFAGIPLPGLLSSFRIKSRITYVFSVDKYIGMADFFDDKIFGLAEVIFWDRETGKKLAYHNFMGPRRRFVPIDTKESACTSFGKTRYVRIAWSRLRSRISLSFIVKGYPFRPAAKGLFISSFKENKNELLFVTPAPTVQRCSATWIIPLKFSGGIATAKHRHYIKTIPMSNGLGMMLMNRTYLKTHSSSEMMFGLVNLNGRDVEFYFSNSDYDPVDDDTYNENFLSCAGEITPMPSVVITHPFGLGKKWVVQDTENMVDLTFTPISLNTRTLNIIIMRKAYTTIFGTFDGVLVTKDGEKLALKNCPGIVRKNLLRL